MKKIIERSALIVCAGFLAGAVTLPERYSNEWTFETDPAGSPLSAAVNSGTDIPGAAFGAGFGATVFTTNHPAAGNVLLCIGEDQTPDQTGVWTSGAVLDAGLPPVSSGVHYLRYDVQYDFRTTRFISGALLGVYFAGDLGGQVAGLVLGCDVGNLEQAAADAGRNLAKIEADMEPVGQLTSIVEVDFSAATMRVWYSLDGSVPFNYTAPNYTGPAPVASIDNLRFHATGGLRPDGSADYAAVQNIRHALGTIPGGPAWEEITEPLVDRTAPPALAVEINDSLGGAMDVGETNRLSVVVRNPVLNGRAAPVTDIGSELAHDGPPSAFAVSGAHAPAPFLRGGESITNVYDVIALEQGSFVFSASGVSTQVASEPAELNMVVGHLLEIIPVTDADIVEVSGGQYDGLYEPGETLEIMITTINSGPRPVSHELNTLVAPPGFTVSAKNARTYGELDPGEQASTTYAVGIGTATPPGTYWFEVVNVGNGQAWTNSFHLLVSTRVPGTDWIKADNNEPLNTQASWVLGQVPDRTDRAVMDATVMTPITTPLGTNLSWRGIALVSNTVDWTISGAQTLTLGSRGVDMHRAGADLRISSSLKAGNSQNWDVAAGRTLTVAGGFASDAGADITKSGDGRLSFVSGPTRRMAGDLVVSNGTLAVSGGFIALDGPRVEAGTPPIGTGRIRLVGGTTLATAGDAGGLTNPITIQSRETIVGGQVIDERMVRFHPGQNLLLAGTIDGTGGILHDGAGVLRLAGTNTYSRGTIVESGSTLEFTHFRALGSGPVTLRDGAKLHGWLPQENLPAERIVSNSIILAGGIAEMRNLAPRNVQPITFSGKISGTGGLRVNLSVGRRDIILSNQNTFQGNLEIFNAGVNVTLLGAGPYSLGNGDIVAIGPQAHLGFNQTGGRISNRIDLSGGSMVFANHRGTTVDFAGEIFGSGTMSFANREGTVQLSGDNRNWSGGIVAVGSFANRFGLKRLIIDHPNALGSGTLVIGGHTVHKNYVEVHVRAPVATRNDLFISDSGPEKERNDLLRITQNSIFGKLDGVSIHQGLDKKGPGRMTLTAQGDYPSPFDVIEGGLELYNAGFPGRVTVSPGAELVASSARTGPILVRSGGRIEVKGSGLHVEDGVLTVEGDAKTILRPDKDVAALRGDPAHEVTLSGIVLLDLSAYASDPAGTLVPVFAGWGATIDQGVTVLVKGLDGFRTIDSSRLFVDGMVRIVEGGRTSSQKIAINVTTGSSGAASVLVHNPGSVTRYFTVKPGSEWPSWLSAAPASRTRLNSVAQATVTVTANAAGLPAGVHRFMLPVVWEHGVSDLILVTVQVEGPSLSVAPSALTLPVVENTTGEGMVDLINTGTLPVSYRARQVLAEHQVYAQIAANLPWLTVSPTAQNQITSFTSGRSAPRAIGFGFPFFETTETEVSIGIDGTLWFGGKPAIRVFANSLSYQSGISRITAQPEPDRFIVTWSRIVQPDSAQQTFQAVLHRDGTIDLRYQTIVGAWQSALIGLHGPTQWFPAQVPETLQGRTIRFARNEQFARISIPEISGRVGAKTTKTLKVTGDASGLSAGDSRTATFAIDYDGGLTGTAGEVAVTMNVHLPASDAASDGADEDLVSPFYPNGSDPLVVLNPPQRTADGGRHLSWSVYSEDGASGHQTYGTEGRYRMQWTTNLASGIWADLAIVTNEVEYTDAKPMDGPVIFYRIVKE